MKQLMTNYSIMDWLGIIPNIAKNVFAHPGKNRAKLRERKRNIFGVRFLRFLPGNGNTINIKTNREHRVDEKRGVIDSSD